MTIPQKLLPSEQKNWAQVRVLVGYLLYHTATTPHQRAIPRSRDPAIGHDAVRKRPITQMNAEKPATLKPVENRAFNR